MLKHKVKLRHDIKNGIFRQVLFEYFLNINFQF